MKLSSVETQKDIVACVDLYLSFNDYTFLQCDRTACIKSFYNHLQQKAFIRCIKEDGIIRAWILAKISISDFTGKRYIQQLYYASSFVGLKAAKAVMLLHEYLTGLAEKLGIYQVVSMGSHMDTKNTFVKILERIGWKVRGYCAIWYLPHGP
jgi:predicted RNA binding protein YcfA (HicA-like mRNA interferase family)